MDINAQRTNDNSQKLNSFVNNRTSVTKTNIGDTITGRIVAGMVIRHNHLWPTLVEEAGGSTVKPTWRGASVNGDNRDPLDVVSEIDKALQAHYLQSTGGDPNRAMSLFGKRTVHLYAWIKREQGKPPEVGLLEANWTVANGIDQLRKKVSPTNPEMLYYGLPYMYDICISKYKNPKTGRPAYEVSPFQCSTEGKIPVKHLEEDKYPITDKTPFFSSEDLEAIAACDWELKDQDVPITSAELLDRLRQFPIDLSRRTRDGKNFMFFRTKTELNVIEEALKHEGIDFISPQPADINMLPDGNNGDYANKFLMSLESSPSQPQIEHNTNSDPNVGTTPVNTQAPPVNNQTQATQASQPGSIPQNSAPVGTAPQNNSPIPLAGYAPQNVAPTGPAPSQANPVPPVGVGNSVNTGNATHAHPGIKPSSEGLPFNGQTPTVPPANNPQQQSATPDNNQGMPDNIDW